MASGNALQLTPDAAGITSGTRVPVVGAGPTQLPARLDQVLAEYAAALGRAPLQPTSRAKYLSRVRGFLAWLAAADIDGDPLRDPAARDWAVRDYRAHL